LYCTTISSINAMMRSSPSYSRKKRKECLSFLLVLKAHSRVVRAI
jgi:hypothetical protein